jgi:hypothetical protein
MGKHLCNAFPVRNALKQGDDLSPLPLSFSLGRPKERIEIEWGTSALGLC